MVVATPTPRTDAFIDGTFRPAASGAPFATENPATGRQLAEVAAGDIEDIDIAVRAARRAFDAGVWSKRSPTERKQVLLRFADLLEANLEELAHLEALDAGKPITDCRDVDIPETVRTFRWYAEALDKVFDAVAPTADDALGLIIREPIGVVGAVLPWNFPLMMAAWKAAPALASGNSLIIKPAELTSVSNLKEIVLECGGKSPQVIMANPPNLDYVADQVLLAGFMNMGENCTCGSRLIVHRSVRDELIDKLVNKTADWPVGDPPDPATRIGPMIERPHLDKVLGYIEAGRAEGARVVVGGGRTLESSGGHFVEPTVFDDVSNSMKIAREEIFGPVISPIPFDTEEEAIAIANETSYGLAASLYTTDLDTAFRLARSIKAGTVSVNSYSEGDITTPFGGFKQSGFGGRDKGLEAFDQYTQKKTVWVTLR